MKKNLFKDKIVLITGSTLGIGKSLAYELARSGATVVLNGRDNSRLKKLVLEMKGKGYKVEGVSADITQITDCEKLIRLVINKYFRIDYLLLLAGLSMNGKVTELKPEVYHKVMQTNYLGSVFPTIYALPYLKESKGSVLFSSSVAGLIGFPGFSAYCASKMSLTAFAESLKNELVGTNVHTGIIHISFTENEPEKRIMAPDGKLMKKIEFNSTMKYHSRELVVKKILNQLEKRRFYCNYSFYGRVIRFMKFIFPNLFLKLIAWSVQRNHSNSELAQIT